MYKAALILCAFLAGAKGDVSGISTLSYNSKLVVARADNYIILNRLQHAKILKDYDIKISMFEEHYLGRTDAVNVQLNMVTASIVQMEERLNDLEVLSDFSKQCAFKYRPSIPTVAVTKTAMTNCITKATNQAGYLLNGPRNTKNSLQNYYLNNFEKETENCGKKYRNTTAEYASCVTTVTSNTNIYTINNQKTFDILMDAATCSANANIKSVLDCSYTIQTSTISKIAEADALINSCLVGKDECKPCHERNSCPVSYDFQVDYKNETIRNPFLGLKSHAGCVLLKLH